MEKISRSGFIKCRTFPLMINNLTVTILVCFGISFLHLYHLADKDSHYSIHRPEKSCMIFVI